MPAPRPNVPHSTIISGIRLDQHRWHKGDGDMWPITWADDDNLYGGAGDNCGAAMNVWRITGGFDWNSGWSNATAWLLANEPVDIHRYCRIPPADRHRGIKPAGMLSLDGILYMAVEAMNYGDNPSFNRQRNIHGWIIRSRDHGQTWDVEATAPDFFDDRLASCHFIQHGRDRNSIRDGCVWATFPCADDGHSYWCNGDGMLLGRVPADRLLQRDAWEFWCGSNEDGSAQWDSDGDHAKEVFRYPRMTGENHVVWNPGLRRYIMGNYSFIDDNGTPRPYHQGWPDSVMRSQLTLYEAPEPWGPWTLFHLDDDWGTVGDYQPNIPIKWISEDGRRLVIVSSGSYDDYCLTMQRAWLETNDAG